MVKDLFMYLLHEKLKVWCNFFSSLGLVFLCYFNLYAFDTFICLQKYLICSEQNYCFTSTLDRRTINKTDGLDFSLISDCHVGQSLVHLKKWSLKTVHTFFADPFFARILQMQVKHYQVTLHTTRQCRNLFQLCKNLFN